VFTRCFACDADTCVKLALMSSSGKEMTRSKTTVRRGQPNPLFKETFMFQVPRAQLSDVTLMVAVNAVRSLKRRSDMIGWFSLGECRDDIIYSIYCLECCAGHTYRDVVRHIFLVVE